MAVVLGALGLMTQVDLDQYYEPIAQRVAPYVPSAWTFGVATVALTIVATVIGLKLLSVGWALVMLYGFSLSREGEDLRTTCGLLTRHSAIVPRTRIQWLATIDNPFQRLLHTVSVRVQTAGAGLKGTSASRQWLAPLAPLRELPRLLREVQPEVSLEDVTWERVHRRAETRLIRKGCVIVVGLTAATVYGAGPWGMVIAVAGLPWVIFAARLRVRAMGYAVRPYALLLRDGWWTRRTSIVRFSKIQSVSISQSPFDRRFRMASLLIDTAGGRDPLNRLAMPFLGLKTARSLALRLREHAAAADFKW
jgi:putative membrane protein